MKKSPFSRGYATSIGLSNDNKSLTSIGEDIIHVQEEEKKEDLAPGQSILRAISSPMDCSELFPNCQINPNESQEAISVSSQSSLRRKYGYILGRLLLLPSFDFLNGILSISLHLAVFLYLRSLFKLEAASGNCE